ncbi:MAG: RNA methyltransferase, partial [Pyrinomonadaceae bacterium]
GGKDRSFDFSPTPNPHPPSPSPRPPLLVILHRVNNPANAGAIVRTAEAAGASALIATEGAVDLFSPKALRGAMGSTFRLPVWEGASLQEALAWCAEQKILTVSTDARAKVNHTEIDWTLPRAIILGTEGAGLSKSEVAVTDDSIKIPMRAPVESLNVAVACGIILYEATRQRATRDKQ